MQAKELFSEVQILTGVNDADQFLTALNNAVANVISELDIANCEYEGYTMPGVDNYKMPERMIDVLAVYLDGVPCRRVNYYSITNGVSVASDELLALYGYSGCGGNKWCLAVDNGLLYLILSPTPQSEKVLLVKGKELPPRIQALEQEIPLPLFCRDAIVKYIIYQIYHNRGDKRSIEALQTYIAEMRSINGKYGGVLRFETGGSVKIKFI